MSIYEMYRTACRTESDINQHLPTLRELALQCSSVVEFGIGNSTLALLAARPWRVQSYDISPQRTNWAIQILQPIIDVNVLFDVHEESSLIGNFDRCDFLFIDSLHTYEQLKEELSRHAFQVHRYIAFHDTVTFGDTGEDGKKPGLGAAIDEFLSNHKTWKHLHTYENNNGLTVIERA